MTDTEPRRIRKIVREPVKAPFFGPETGNRLLNEKERQTVPKQIADGVNQDLRIPHSTPRVVEGYVTLPQLAAQLNMQAQLARLWVKAAGIKKPADGRWRWKEGSRELSRVRKALARPVPMNSPLKDKTQ